MVNTDNPSNEEDIKNEIAKIVSGETQLAQMAASPEVQAFLQLQKKVETTATTLWAAVQNEMIAAGIKSVKGPWGSVTVAERANFDVDMDELPKRFIVKTADKKKIALEYKLKGVAPAGVEVSHTTYLTKRLKIPDEITPDNNSVIEGEIE